VMRLNLLAQRPEVSTYEALEEIVILGPGPPARLKIRITVKRSFMYARASARKVYPVRFLDALGRVC